MAFIEVTSYDDSTGELRQVYDDLIKSRGKLAEVHKIQSLNPKSIVDHMELYMTIMFGRSPLKRYQRELMAVVVSSANKCEYCIRHHSEALNHFWKDDEKIEKLIDNYAQAGLDDADIALANYAYFLTKEPQRVSEKMEIEDMKNAGFEDRSILDAALVIAYFNFVNRLVLGLGVELEEDAGEGFNYD